MTFLCRYVASVNQAVVGGRLWIFSRSAHQYAKIVETILGITKILLFLLTVLFQDSRSVLSPEDL